MPLAKKEPGETAEKDKHDHVNAPARKLKVSHSHVSQAVEKKLPIPKASRQNRESEIQREGAALGTRREFDIFSQCAVSDVEPEALNASGQECPAV